MRTIRLLACLLAATLLLAACTSPDRTTNSNNPDPAEIAEQVGDCIHVPVAVSSEKIDLMTDLAQEFNRSDLSTVDGTCVAVTVASKASGGAAQLLADQQWNEDIEGPKPVVWSPASSAWGQFVNANLQNAGADPIVGDMPPFMQSPLVIAMPEPMADALGYPDNPIGWSDILQLARSDAGWAEFGHPEWGQFRLGKTNPHYSTSGLSALIAQTYAAAGKTTGLTGEDISRPEVQQFASDVEQSVVHYGDTTLTFLNNWYRNDRRGTALTYASAAAVEEVSVVQYNRGNPDGVLEPGEQPTPPRVPLVAVYPTEGTLFSDNPFIILDADWVEPKQTQAAAKFGEYVMQPQAQQRVLEFGFRPGNPDVAITDPISQQFGVDPTQPQTTLEVPDGDTLIGLVDNWDTQRKAANVTLLLDVSGSMGDSAGDGRTKLDLAVDAAIVALDQFADHDTVGLRVFTTDIGPNEHPEWIDIVEPGPVPTTREEIKAALRRLVPMSGTPLYTATGDTYQQMADSYDPNAINAMVVLTDGQNEDVNTDLQGLLGQLQDGSEGAQSRPVRVFTIGYGSGADMATLTSIAEATDARAYSAQDPATIDKVFTSVISNF